MPDSLPRLFDRLLRARPSLPFVTYYDEGNGERAEVSAKSAANWVAKIHHYFQDDLGLGIGDRALLGLPPDWLCALVILGAWSAGLEVVTSGAAAVAVLIEGSADADEVVRVNPAALSRSGAWPNDFVAAVRPMPDAWGGVHSPTTANDLAFSGLTGAQLLAEAPSWPAGQRSLLAVTPDDSLPPLVTALAATLAGGGSLVLVRTDGPDEALRRRRAEQEHAQIIG